MSGELIPNLCGSCLLRRPGGMVCVAFPDGIPTEIRFGEDHREPVDGDGGLVWQFDPTRPEQYADWIGYNGGIGRREEESG